MANLYYIVDDSGNFHYSNENLSGYTAVSLPASKYNTNPAYGRYVIIDSKYRKKSHEYLYNTIDKKFNTSNKNTNLSLDFYSKTAKKTDAARENKSFINSLSKSNELNNKPSIITQEKVIKRVDIPSSISKFTIEANSKKPKTAKNKKVQQHQEK